jgi:hypothetical protein
MNAVLYSIGSQVLLLSAFGGETLARGRDAIEAFFRQTPVNLTASNSKPFPWAQRLAARVI